MDLILLIGIAVALLVVIFTIYFLQKKSSQTVDDQPKQRQQRGTAVRVAEGVPRRAQIARNQRNRLRTNAAANAADDQESTEEPEEGPSTSNAFPEAKIGAKKRAKLEAKAEKRVQREQEMKAKEDKKAREQKQDEERKQLDEKEAEDERKADEAERLAREERERKEHEEYLKMKAAFSIEEEGFEENDTEKENLLQEFVQYIKDNKVVVLEDLAVHFNLKTQQAIDRITELQANDTLTGVIDDRGKFIYISEEELLAVAKFINQRGRVSIAELAECSSQLINLTPVSK